MSWPEEDDPQLSRSISFTLPLKLPRAGGGLTVWDLEYEEFLDARRRGYVETIAEIQRFKKSEHVPYRIGEMVVHSGHRLHQIAPVESVDDDDERMTLQGHGVPCASGWVLYW
jgi:hypothetical protein